MQQTFLAETGIEDTSNARVALIRGTQIVSAPLNNIGLLTTDDAATTYQPLDATLTSLAAFNTNGFLVQTAANTFAGRTLQEGQGIALTNPAGTAGDPTIAMANGAVVDSIAGSYTTNADITGAGSVIPFDDTIPQNTEGTQIISVSITPKSTTNKLRCRFSAEIVTNTNSSVVQAAMFRGGVANAIAASYAVITTAEFSVTLAFEHEFVPASTSAQTISVRVGPSSAVQVMRLNGNTALGRRYGGAMGAWLVVEEIKA